MQLDVVDILGKVVGQIDVADAVFAHEVKEHLLWEMVKAQRAARRAGTHDTKTRANVRGGGRKPYRQKGTGGARQGSTRSPQFVGGGVVFGPHPRSYEYTVPKKVKRAALASALSLRAQEKKIVVIDGLNFDAPKTKDMAAMLKAIGAISAVIVSSKDAVNTVKSVRNLKSSKYLPPEGLNVYDILNHETLVISKDVIRAVEGRVVAAESAEVAPSA